jgi:uncharacterized protein (DUF2147 family)
MRFLIAAAALLAASHTSSMASETTGKWWTEEKKGIMEVYACPEGLCGKLVGFVEPYDDKGQPKHAKNGAPECGLSIMHAHVSDEAGIWEGIITDPRDLSDWSLKLSYRDDGGLHLRGYLLTPILGKSQDWDKFTGKVNDKCEIVK